MADAIMVTNEQIEDVFVAVALDDLMRLWDMATHAPMGGDAADFLQRIDRSHILSIPEEEAP